MKSYERLDHPSDLKIRSYGKTLQELFINTARGMMHYLYGKPRKITSIHYKIFKLSAEDAESLLVNWLSELLSYSDIHHVFAISYEISEWDIHHLKGRIGFIKAHAKQEIKAVTYCGLKIIQNQDSKNKTYWTTTTLYDL